jgi:hypothetical protein
MIDMTDESKSQQVSGEAGEDALILEDSLSYGRRKGFIKYKGKDFLVSAIPFFWMIDFNQPPAPGRRALLEGKGFEKDGGLLWMLCQDAMSTDDVMALARALEPAHGV